MVSIKTKEKFEDWKKNFKETLEGYDYFTDFNKVVKNAGKYKKELDLISSIISKNKTIKTKSTREKNIKKEFLNLVEKEPSVLECIPLLIAVRLKKGEDLKIKAEEQTRYFRFDKESYNRKQYEEFMEKTGLFELLSNQISCSLYDYVLGVETGLDTHSRKNRSGKLMENIVDDYLKEANVEYRTKLKSDKIEEVYGVDASSLKEGDTSKIFDYVVKGPKFVYGIEVNYFRDRGSKPSEINRSYQLLAEKAEKIDNFEFVWITDGPGWKKVENALEGAYKKLDNLYCIHDIEEGLFKQLK